MSSINPVSSSDPRISENVETNNFMRRLAGLVAEVYATFSKISQNDRQEIARIEKKYTLSTTGHADSLRSQGNIQMGAAFAAVAAFAIATAIANPNDQAFVKKMSEHVGGFSQLFVQQSMGNQKNFEGLSSIQFQKLQDKSSRSQSDGNIKETFAQVLQAEMQRHRSASASSN